MLHGFQMFKYRIYLHAGSFGLVYSLSDLPGKCLVLKPFTVK